MGKCEVLRGQVNRNEVPFTLMANYSRISETIHESRLRYASGWIYYTEYAYFESSFPRAIKTYVYGIPIKWRICLVKLLGSLGSHNS